MARPLQRGSPLTQAVVGVGADWKGVPPQAERSQASTKSADARLTSSRTQVPQALWRRGIEGIHVHGRTVGAARLGQVPGRALGVAELDQERVVVVAQVSGSPQLGQALRAGGAELLASGLVVASLERVECDRAGGVAGAVGDVSDD